MSLELGVLGEGEEGNGDVPDVGDVREHWSGDVHHTGSLSYKSSQIQQPKQTDGQTKNSKYQILKLILVKETLVGYCKALFQEIA